MEECGAERADVLLLRLPAAGSGLLQLLLQTTLGRQGGGSITSDGAMSYFEQDGEGDEPTLVQLPLVQ